MKHKLLMHDANDDVAVAVVDLLSGVEATAVTLEGETVGAAKPTEDIPLGHKVAMRDIPKGTEVMKYGRCIGEAAIPISKGGYVHTHNLKSLRWRN